MSMRRHLVATVSEELGRNANLVLLLGDIGVFGFNNAFKAHPDRVFNIGILEGATISLASGMARIGLIPVVHTIAPFLVERAYEQLKIDFAYQKYGGTFISVGASYDYASLGCTHHCPGDVGALLNIPEMEVIVPGNAQEFDRLFKQTYRDSCPKYIRLSERENVDSHEVEFGKANIVKHGSKATVIAIGPMLDKVLSAAQDLDVTILYYTTIAPFDSDTLSATIPASNKIIVVEPYYEGTTVLGVMTALQGRQVAVTCIGIPRSFIRNYGKPDEHDKALGLDTDSIARTIRKAIDD